jgi:hypothetical protein
MTTPQSILHNIEYKLSSLLKEFYKTVDVEYEEKTISLIDSIQETMKNVEEIKKDMEALKNTMILILKVLNDDR